MKMKWIILGALLLTISAVGPPVYAQNAITGNLNAATTTCLVSNSCLTLNIPIQMGGATIKLSGTFSGTVQFEASADPLTVLPTDAAWVAISATPSNSTTTATSATAGGVWQINIAGYNRIRIRVSTYASGTIAGAINLSTASARAGGGGGGSGTTTSQTKYGFSYNSTGIVTAVDASVTAPATVGTFIPEILNPTAAATAPAMVQVGLAGRDDEATSASPIVAADTAGGIVVYQAATAAAVTVPNVGTLANTNPAFATDNGLGTGNIVFTPTSEPATINNSSTWTQWPKQRCTWIINPKLATDWDTKCFDQAGYMNGGFIPTSTTGLATDVNGQPAQQTGANVTAIVQTLTGCNTATYTYTPQANDCVAPAGGVAKIPIQLPVAVAQGSGVSLGGSGAAATLPGVALLAGSSTVPQVGEQVYAFASLGSQYVDYPIVLPSVFNSIDSIVFKVSNDTVTSGTDYMNFQYKCIADGTAETPTYAGVQQASGAVPGTTGLTVTLTLTTPTITGCSAGNVMFIRIGAGTGSGVFASGNLDLYQAKVELH